MLKNTIAAGKGTFLPGAYLLQGVIHDLAGRSEQAVDASLSAAAAYRDQGRWGGVVTATSNAILFLSHLGRYGDALTLYESLREEIDGKENLKIAALLSNAGTAYLVLGIHDKAISVEQEALERAKVEGNDHVAVQAQGNLAIAYFRSGDYERALGTVEGILDAGTRRRFPHETAASQWVRARCLVRLQRIEDAKKALDEAAEQARATGNHDALVVVNDQRGELAHMAGNPKEALALYQEALTHARGNGRARRGVGRAAHGHGEGTH